MQAYHLYRHEVISEGKSIEIFKECLRTDDGEGVRGLITNLFGQRGPNEIRGFPNVLMENGYTPLAEAVWRRKKACIFALLDHPHIQSNWMGKDGVVGGSMSAITLAMRIPKEDDVSTDINLDLVQHLLSHPKIDLNTPPVPGHLSAMQVASIYHSPIFLEYFLSREDADVNREDAEGRTCLSLAVKSCKLQHIRLLLRHEKVIINPILAQSPESSKSSIIMETIMEAKSRIVRMLLASGANPDYKKKFGDYQFYEGYATNFIMLTRSCTEAVVESRLDIAYYIWEVNGKLDIPQGVIRRIRSDGPATEEARVAFTFAIRYITEILPSQRLSVLAHQRMTIFYGVRQEGAAESLRLRFEQTVEGMDIPDIMKSYFLFDNHDLEQRGVLRRDMY